MNLQNPFSLDLYLVRQEMLPAVTSHSVLDSTGEVIFFIEHAPRSMRNVFAIACGFGSALAIIIPAFVAASNIKNDPLSVAVGLGGFFVGLIALFAVTIAMLPPIRVSINGEDATSLDLVINQVGRFRDRSTFSICDASGTTIGWLRRRSPLHPGAPTWTAYSATWDALAIARDQSFWKPRLKRIYRSGIRSALQTNFDITDSRNGERLGAFDRLRPMHDRFVLDLKNDQTHRFDRRLGLALGVMIDASESS